MLIGHRYGCLSVHKHVILHVSGKKCIECLCYCYAGNVLALRHSGLILTFSSNLAKSFHNKITVDDHTVWPCDPVTFISSI